MDGLSKNQKALNILFIVLLVAILLVGVALRVHAWLFSSQLYSERGMFALKRNKQRILGRFFTARLRSMHAADFFNADKNSLFKI